MYVRDHFRINVLCRNHRELNSYLNGFHISTCVCSLDSIFMQRETFLYIRFFYLFGLHLFKYIHNFIILILKHFVEYKFFYVYLEKNTSVGNKFFDEMTFSLITLNI